jgi:hypothetical protein
MSEEGVIAIFFIVMLLIIGGFYLNAKAWDDAAPVEIKCELISKSYKGSTLQSNAVPTVTSNGGVGVGVVTTGDSEQYISAFECEGIGTVISKNKEIFTKAKKNNILLVKFRGDDYRIENIN